jgi:hypothetical protein
LGGAAGDNRFDHRVEMGSCSPGSTIFCALPPLSSCRTTTDLQLHQQTTVVNDVEVGGCGREPGDGLLA